MERTKEMKREQKGFTLIELIVVISIISLLVVFVAPRMFRRLTEAKRDLAVPRMKIVETALESFAINCGRYPDDSEGLEVLLVAPEGLSEKWRGPYLKRRQMLDPWDNPFIYEAGEGGNYLLVSYGADGRAGGDGDNSDITNEEE
jgi:general secretion pathway protein G